MFAIAVYELGNHMIGKINGSTESRTLFQLPNQNVLDCVSIVLFSSSFARARKFFQIQLLVI